MIMGDRDEYIAGHVTPEVKAAMRTTAASRGESMSKFMSDAIEARLKELGVKVLPLGEPGPRLPFEGDACSTGST